ncbi:hypothetical protein D3C75_1109000 [compost metagenome]
MPLDGQSLRAVGCYDFYEAVPVNRLMKVNESAIDFTGYCIFLQACADGFRYLCNCGAAGIPPNCSIRQCCIDIHDCGLHFLESICV